MAYNTLKIISGGQTGVDRAALDAAIANNSVCGGWCPRGRKAEDGRISDQYPLIELDSLDYAQRTLRNIAGSDGTVIIYFEKPYGGTELTLTTCMNDQVPYLELDGEKLTVEQAAKRITTFIVNYRIKVLNVAGPRASEHADAYQYAFHVISQALE